MSKAQRVQRLAEIARTAREAEAQGDGWAAAEAWRDYELVRDGGRAPDTLIAEGLAFSRVAHDLAAQREPAGA